MTIFQLFSKEIEDDHGPMGIAPTPQCQPRTGNKAFLLKGFLTTIVSIGPALLTTISKFRKSHKCVTLSAEIM